MATKKSTPADEKFEKIDFDLFEAITALDKKDYDYYDRLTTEQKKKFSPYMMLHWMSTIKGNGMLQSYYLQSTNINANKHMLDGNVTDHPKLQWLMLCAASPGMGKQFHQWIPNLSGKISQLKETPKEKDVVEYYTKIYPKASDSDRKALASVFVEAQKTKVYLAKKFPHLKIEDIETLSQIVTDEDIKQYEKDSGN
jgi:hypothetical protein